MVIDNTLKQRIIRSLRWLVHDAQWRFNECKDGLDSGSQSYSPELKEAIHLLEDMVQTTMAFDSGQDCVAGWSEQECKDAAVMLGLGEELGSEFYVQYRPQGWCWGGGMPITDLHVALRRFKGIKKTATPDVIKTQSGKTPLQRYYEDH